MDIRHSDLPLLVSLDVLLEECNVTRAAARLNLSQPALSTQLARLRAVFGDPLLVPSESGRGMVATARGLALAGPLKHALQQLHAVVGRDAAFDPRTAERTFTVAANDNLITMLGVELARRITQSGGTGLRLSFRDPDPAMIVGQMERGEIDLMLSSTRLVPQVLKARMVSTERYHVAQRKGHPRGRVDMSLEAYCALPHLLVSKAGDFHSFIDDQLSKLGQRRQVAITVPHYNAVPAMLMGTDALCTLPIRFLRRFADQLDIFPLPFELPAFQIAMAWHARSDNDPALKWLRGLLLDAELPPDAA
ncbi:MAG: LysR family transcriptional regulator [Burkholderiales bacterium]|nr:LysR family transcriptional regulator [Burkholderiales bacterium]